MDSQQVRLLDGSTFAISDRGGDIGAGTDVEGVFYRDVRHLSRWQILVDGQPLRPVAGELLEYDTGVFYAVEPTPTVDDPAHLILLRERHLGPGMRERLTLTNRGTDERKVTVVVRFAADFADIFEVKKGMSKSLRPQARAGDGEAELCYRRADYRRGTHLRAPGAFLTTDSATYQVTIPASGQWSVELELSLSASTKQYAITNGHRPQMDIGLSEWLAQAPSLDADWPLLRRIYRRSLVDLAALRFYPDVTPRASLLAGGMPWYMALFGRDSLIASYEALPFVPELCRTTLRALASEQSSGFDDMHDAEPGKIMHELRHGELVHFGQRPQSPYYGTCDATPLFLIVLEEYWRWTGDADTIRELEGAARAALEWVEHYGDLDGDGYLEYQTRNPRHGMPNQCWKDSAKSILYPDGRLAPLPRATCEIQGYAYDARLRTAALARQVWGDNALADRLERAAGALKEAFNRDFWLPETGYYALALDGDKQPVPTLASNPGQLLWSGIVPDDRVEAVVGHLLGRNMFSGWGVRTLAAGQPVYNPVEYHNGTVWPHDNALIAAGLARYGRRDEANRLATGILEAGGHFHDRLPEVFSGEDRDRIPIPLPYPGAGCPQAWATASPLLLIRVMLGLDANSGEPRVDAHLPEPLSRLTLRGVASRQGRVDVSA